MANRSTRRPMRTSRRSLPAGAPPVGVAGVGDVPVVGGREPCPCGSGRRYKACHGRARQPVAPKPVRRPFEGLRSECDLVALREFVPAATAPLPLIGQYAERTATLATVLPMAAPAVTRPDGSVFVGMQVAVPAPDPARQLAAALQAALVAELGTEVDVPDATPPDARPTADGPRLADLLDADARLDVTVHDGFGFWADGAADPAPELAAVIERANASVPPTARLASVDAAYWSRERDRAFLRWVLPHDERPLLDAWARLHAARADGLGEGTRYVGSFRAHGLLVPVWEVPADRPAEAYEDAAAHLAGRLGEALADGTPLTDAQRRARDGLLSRQLTIR
jgi:hypothetical protein